jgi:hypothetical protein
MGLSFSSNVTATASKRIREIRLSFKNLRRHNVSPAMRRRRRLLGVMLSSARW